MTSIEITVKTIRQKLKWYRVRFFEWVVEQIQSRNLDGSTYIIPGKAVENLFSSKYNADKKLLKKIDKAITKERRVLKTHFTKPGHGWDLNTDYIISNILREVFGITIEEYILGRLVRGRPIDLKLKLNSGYRLTKRGVDS